MSLDFVPLNTLHRLIDEALPGEPELKRECHDLATSRCAGERVLAVMGALLSRMHAERLPKPRLYVFSPRWLEPLKALLAISSGGVREAYIQDFATMGTNTFARAAHFGVVAKGSKPGWWRLTERGYAFLAGRAPIPAAMSYSGGASKVWLHGPTPRGRYGGKPFVYVHDVERELGEG